MLFYYLINSLVDCSIRRSFASDLKNFKAFIWYYNSNCDEILDVDSEAKLQKCFRLSEFCAHEPIINA